MQRVAYVRDVLTEFLRDELRGIRKRGAGVGVRVLHALHRLRPHAFRDANHDFEIDQRFDGFGRGERTGIERAAVLNDRGSERREHGLMVPNVSSAMQAKTPCLSR